MKVLIKGAGDLATGIGWRLKRAGYEVWMTEIEVPTAVRRTVSYSRAVYEGSAEIEGIRACLVHDLKEGQSVVLQGEIPVIIDENDQPKDQVTIGSKVAVTCLKNGMKGFYQVVGSQEADPMHGAVSEESPFGKALLGAKAGDEITVEAPVGAIVYRIDSIDR